MCGFAGFFGFRDGLRDADERLNVLRGMSKPIARRGPDDEKFFDDGSLCFTFRRLSIVDLHSGQQPIWNEDETRFVSINGEIYNHLELRSRLKGEHRFRTHSDSEIVLHLYEEMGPRCLDLLVGMFAIVIYDKNKKELFMARDRMGIKPLYYAALPEGVVFGSELKALLAFPGCPREVDWKFLRLGIPTLGNLVSDRVSTYVKGIEFLPGGSYAVVNLESGLAETKYWDLQNYFPEPGAPALDENEYVARYADLIEDSVKKRLMSDVPVGSFLSGGLDSALVTAIAAKGNKDIHCFHALEQTTFLCGDTAAAEKLARTCGLPFHPVFFDSEKLINLMRFSLEEFEYFIWMMDSPRFDVEWLFKHELHRFAKSNVPSLKVMLLGQGADEFAHGYSNLNKLNGDWETYAHSVLKRGAQWRWFESNDIPQNVRSLLSEDLPASHSPGLNPSQEMVLGRVKMLQAQNLWHEDRSSSVQGVESRVPFLDHRLVQFLVSIPQEMHSRLFWDKKIVRLAAERFLPKELANRPKIGFYKTRNETSVWNLKRSIIEKIFGEFAEKYLGQSDSLFSAEALNDLYVLSQVHDSTSWSSIDTLISCMSLACFDAMVKRPSAAYLGVLTPPSPLSEVRPDQAAKIWKISEWDLQQSAWHDNVKRWQVNDCPILADGIKVVFHLPDTVHLRAGDTDKLVFDLKPGMDWLLNFLRLISSENYKPLNLDQLSKKLKVTPNALKGTIRVLSRTGTLTVYRKLQSAGKKAA